MSLLKGMGADLTFGSNDPFKLSIPDVSKHIMVLVGQNGSGKTMFLTCTWFGTFMLGLYQIALATSPAKADTLFAENATAAASMTFNNSETMSGIFTFSGKQGDLEFEFIMYFENGELVNHVIDIPSPELFATIQIQPVIYNSKEARLFTSYERYLEILSMVGMEQPKDLDDFKKVGKVHKLYDIMWFEHVRGKLKIWERDGISPEASSRITNFHRDWPSDHDAFGANPTLAIRNNIPFIKSDTLDKKLSDFGGGHQAVLMTTLFL